MTKRARESVTSASAPPGAPPVTLQPRIWELDFLRGLAVILMVLYHLGFDLTEFCGIRSVLGIRFDISGRGIEAAQFVFAGLFIVLCGISSTLTRSNIRRALKILAVAVAVTIVTFFFNASSAIYFGILHCLAISILIYGLTLHKAGAFANAAAGAFVLALSVILSSLMRGVAVDFDWLIPFGITSGTFASYDYFPLLPWFGVFLLGTALGKSVYARKQSVFSAPLPETVINAAGRHSLLIYIIHQPVIMGVLYVAGFMR